MVCQELRFFGAPVGLFCLIDRKMGPPQWSDLGMYLQTAMLYCASAGSPPAPRNAGRATIARCASFLGAPEELMLFCGMAIGYADESSAVNRLDSERISLDDFASFHGF